MRFVLYTNSVSAHQLPLAHEIIKRVGGENFRYIYTGRSLQGGNQEVQPCESWIVQESNNINNEVDVVKDWLENCDTLLVGGLRPIDLLERRSAKGLKTFYQSERWFKPIPVKLPIPHIFTFHSYALLPGIFRLFVPSYRRMVKRFLRLMNDDPNFFTLPIGTWAKKDFLRLGVHYDRLIDWGYFVEESKRVGKRVKNVNNKMVNILYVGRLLQLKRVDTIIRAITYLNTKQSSLNTNKQYILTIIGDGPEKPYLQRLASDLQLQLSTITIFFQPSVPISEVRKIMRQHDVLVFASNALDGWGAVVSEALTERIPVVGTFETGASAALLPKKQLFHCGDWRELATIIQSSDLTQKSIPVEYTAAVAAQKLII